MKNKLFLVGILFFLGAQLTISQIQGTSSSSASGDVQFAAKAGFNIASLGGENVYNYATKPGFHVGGLVEIPFSDKILLQPEVLISLQGSGTLYTDNVNLFYLNVPLMAKYNVWDALYIEAGPQLGLLLSSNIDENTYGTLVTPDKNSLDVGIGIGAGYRLNDNFYFQVRFVPGFINVVKDIKSKNRVFQISASYFFL